MEKMKIYTVENFKSIETIAEKAHVMLVDQRIKLTGNATSTSFIDDEWRSKHGGVLDLKNTKLQDLPHKWKSERMIGATIAFDKVSEKMSEKGFCDEQDVEEIAEFLHDSWLRRNPETAKDGQKHKYKDMTEDEKEKDRFFVRAAIEVIMAISKSTS